jgi:hypothetical protein
MPDTIIAGNILVEEGIRLPKSLQDQSEPNSNGWAAVKGARSAFVQAIQEAGWSFFFMAGEIKTTVFGFDREKALHAALKRLMADAKSQQLQQYRDYADPGQITLESALRECFRSRAASAEGHVFFRLTERAPIRHSFHRLNLNRG